MNEYRGLINEGSTCYLNSLLQTLFMTPEFRSNVYSYVHDEKKIKAVDSIAYQLQKIFVKLQLNKQSVYTKGLLKSFQWNQVDSFTQHDVQQFCRVLFEALEKAHKGVNWIEKLYSGTMESYISCGQHTRCTPELFMDLSLPIRNQFTQEKYQSIEQSLMNYLKPQNLQDKIECEQCGERVKVTKGVKFTNLPKILTLQLNRFQLNYNTFQREKVNSFLYFPEVLEMDRFLRPYQQIAVKGMPEDLTVKTVIKEKQKSSRTTDYWGSDLMVTGQAIKKRKNSDDIEVKTQKIKFFDEEGKDQRQNATRQLTAEEQKMKNLQLLKQMKAEKDKIDQKMKKITNQGKEPSDNKQQKPVQKKKQPPITTQNAYDSLEDDMLFGSFMADVDKNFTAGSFDKGDVIGAGNPASGSAPTFQKTVASFEHQQEQFDINKEYPENTYILYSILVHSGGAYGGHYYAYIFNGSEWFRFDDNKVTKASKSDIRKYGNPSQNVNYGANAYLLFYREARSFKESLLPVEIPEALLEKVNNDKTVETVSEEKKFSRLDEINNTLLVKIFKNSQIQDTFAVNKLEETIGSLRQKVKALFEIEEQDHNWRLRRYNKGQDSMHEIYGEGLYETSLHDLGMRESCYMIVETKDENEEFSEYDPRNITVKVNAWREDLTILTQQYLKPHKIQIRQENTFGQFYEKIKKSTGIENPLVIKRNFSVGNPLTIFDLENNKEKTLLSLRFFNGINLYTQQKDKSGQIRWKKEFEDEKYRCLIKFNNPKQGAEMNLELFIDTRKTLGDLKQRISEMIGLAAQDFRIKKSQQTVTEMTTFKKRLTDLRFVNNQFLYIEEGKSSKGTILIRKGIASIIEDQIDFSVGEELQIPLTTEVTTVADLKIRIGEKYGVEPFSIRIRELKFNQFAEIFSDEISVQKLKEKSLVWEEIDIEDPRGLQIYIRVFDAMKMQFGPLQSIFLESSANYEELTLLIEEETRIQADKVLIWKSLASYIQKSMMFECEWFETKFIPNPVRLEPFYLSTDGQILIVKESLQPYHPKPFKKHESVNEYETTATGSVKRKGEASLKITVVEQKEDIDENAEEPTQTKQTNTDLPQKEQENKE